MADYPSQRSRKLTAGSRVQGSQRSSARSRRSGGASSRSSTSRAPSARALSAEGITPGSKQEEPSTSASAAFRNRFAEDKHFKSSVKLRSVRDELLRVRTKLQRTLSEKYGGKMDKLLKFFDSDHDGEISLKDFLGGVKEYHWPVSRDEALLIFAGIDEDGSGGLDFQELVNVFEPASLASAHASAAEGAETATEDIEGFVRFTPHQVSNFESLKAFTPRGTYLPRQKDPMVEAVRRAAKVEVTEDDVKRVCGGMAPDSDETQQTTNKKLVAPLMPDGSYPPVSVAADGRVDLYDASTDGPAPFDELLKRPPATVVEELDLVKRQIAGRIRRRGADFFQAWRRFDQHDRGFLNQQQFVGVCGPKGFDLGLSRRGIRALLGALSDAGGAVEPMVFDSFLKAAATDQTTGQAMQQASMAHLRALQSRAESWELSGGAESIKAKKPVPADQSHTHAHALGSRGSRRLGSDESGMELNRTALLRQTLPAGAGKGGPTKRVQGEGHMLHPTVLAALSDHNEAERAQVCTTFGAPSDPLLQVPLSARDDPLIDSGRLGPQHGGDHSHRHALHAITTSSARSSGQGSHVSSGRGQGRDSHDTPGSGRILSERAATAMRSRRRVPIPRSLGLATQWSDLSGDTAPNQLGPSPADRSHTGVSTLRRRMMYAKSLPSLPGVGSPTQRGLPRTSDPIVASTAMTDKEYGDSAMPLSHRLAASSSGRAVLSSTALPPRHSARLIGESGDGSDSSRMEAMFADAGVRAERTWRTALRPRRGEDSTAADPGSAAHQDSSERFLRKSLLAPGEWERVCASATDPAAHAVAVAAVRTGDARAAVSRLPPVGPHGKALGRTVAGVQGAVASLGTGQTAARLRGELRAKQGQTLLVGIQQRADQAAELTALRAEARAVAKASQRLHYARRSLGITEEQMNAPVRE